MRELLGYELERLERLAGVRGALIVDAQAGVPVATGSRLALDPDAVAALATTFAARIARAAGASDFGEVSVAQLAGESGNLVMATSGELLVIVVADTEARPEELRLEVRRVAEELR